MDGAPHLSDAQIERLAILSEELGEAQQIVGKILRHGFFSRNPFIENSPQNYEMLERELGDIEFAIALMSLSGDPVRPNEIHHWKNRKGDKIKPFLRHQRGSHD